MVTILHAVDTETLVRIAVVGPKGIIEHVIPTVVSFLDELASEALAEERQRTI